MNSSSSSGVKASFQSIEISAHISQEKSKKTALRGGEPDIAQEAATKVDIQLRAVYKSLTIVGDEIIKKLDEILKGEGTEGLSGLSPEDHTPEATADRIVSGITSLFGVFSKQNPEMQGEELVNKFMETIRGGVAEGQRQAMSILGDIGALDIDGVESGVAQTMKLVEEKLSAFEAFLKDNLKEEAAAVSPKEGDAQETS